CRATRRREQHKTRGGTPGAPSLARFRRLHPILSLCIITGSRDAIALHVVAGRADAPAVLGPWDSRAPYVDASLAPISP
ncbi:MAG: hypothetical protein ACREM1_20975, partial [Longimicrobiales bacterium]